MSWLSKLLGLKPKARPVPPAPKLPFVVSVHVTTIKKDVVVPVAEALVTWDGTEPGEGQTDENGAFSLPARLHGGFNINVYGPEETDGVYTSVGWLPVSAETNAAFDVQLDFEAKPKRKGAVRIDQYTFVDWNREFLATGTTLFWLVWGYKNDRDRLAQNLQFLADRHVDYIRALALVNGSSWADRAAKPEDLPLIGEITDWVYDTFGLRTQWTIFGAVDDLPTTESRKQACITIADQLKVREDKVQLVEISNESYDNGPDVSEMRAFARVFRDRGYQGPLALSAPQAIDADHLNPLYQDLRQADVATLHLDRDISGTGGRWRPVRQAREGAAIGMAWTSNEPIGPQSSINEDDDPERLAISAALVWLCKGAGYVYHPGAGVRGGGQADRDRGRAVNMWDVNNIEQTLFAIYNLKQILPPTLPDWQWWNGNRAAGAGHPFDGQLLQDQDNILLRAFAAVRGSDWVCIPISMTGAVQFKARNRMTFDVYDWHGNHEGTHDLSAGDTFTIGPRGSAIFIGKNL